MRHNDTYFSLLCVPTRFTHYCCLLPFISLCRPQDSRSMGSSAGQVFLALEKAMFIYPFHRLLGHDESMWEKGATKLLPLPHKKSHEADVSLFITTITRRQNEEFALFRVTISPRTGPFRFCICCAFILSFPLGK